MLQYEQWAEAREEKEEGEDYLHTILLSLVFQRRRWNRRKKFSCYKQIMEAREMNSHPSIVLCRPIRREIVIKMIMKNHLLTMCDYNRKGGWRKKNLWFIASHRMNWTRSRLCFVDVFYDGTLWLFEINFSHLFTQIGLVRSSPLPFSSKSISIMKRQLSVSSDDGSADSAFCQSISSWFRLVKTLFSIAG